ncbi:programmed cell death protein 10-like [Lineus longissimus]|uniref:programmed cell death protein 10-like n=1 Tax=Lineus longissimus TaxID=88925 RepID=UPI002B4D23A8
MTMGEETLHSQMALPVVIGPILEKLEKKDIAAAQTLRAAFTKVEVVHPGFTYDLIKALLHKGEVFNKIDMCEALLRLEKINESEEFQIDRSEDIYRTLNVKSRALKKILSWIPDEIHDRKKFLETIKDIANAIRNLLDSVSKITEEMKDRGNPQLQNLEQQKREFVKYSKRFSNTLKTYFKDGHQNDVYISANHLIHQTNLIMKTLKVASS